MTRKIDVIRRAPWQRMAPTQRIFAFFQVGAENICKKGERIVTIIGGRNMSIMRS
jgi:hypothetical protein